MRLFPLALAAAFLLTTLPVRAQTGGDARGRARFRAGVAAAEDGRWEEALEAFEEAYQRLPVPAVLFNLAGALAQNGRLREAAAAYSRFESESPDPALRTAAQRERSAVEARLAYVEVLTENLQPGDHLSIDGVPLDTAATYDPVPLDPGPHLLEVRRGSAQLASERVVLREGEHRDVVLRVAPAQALGLDTPDPAEPLPPHDEGEPWFASPVLWTIVGVLVVGAAAGVTVGVVVTQPQGPGAPMTDRGPLEVR